MDQTQLATKAEDRQWLVKYNREIARLGVPTTVATNLDLGGAPKYRPEGYGHVLRVCYRDEAPYKVRKGVEVKVLEFDDNPDPRQLPPRDTLESLADWINQRRKNASVFVHCRMGMNRSGLVTALALLRSGRQAEEVIKHLRAARSSWVLSNTTFEKFIRAYPKVEGFYDGAELAVCQARQLELVQARQLAVSQGQYAHLWDDEYEC